MAYINTSGRPSRWEHSESRDRDVHGAGVYWLMGVIKFAGGTIRLWGCRGVAPVVRYEGILGMSVWNPYSFVRSPYSSVHTGFRAFSLYIYIYIYLIDVNLDYYQNNSRFSVDVGKLPNHIKSVCPSLLISLF